MKSAMVFALMFASIFVSCGEEPINSKSESVPLSKEQMRAKNGEEVWIIVTYVKNELKPEFEKWIKEIFYPALHKSQNPMNKFPLHLHLR